MPDRPATARPVRPAQRYGDAPSPLRLGLLRAAGAAVAALGVALVVWIGWHQADRPVRGDVVGFDLVTDESLRVQVRVTKDEDAEVACRVVARDASASVVGAEEVQAGPGDGDWVTLRVVVATSGRPVTAEVAGCRET